MESAKKSIFSNFNISIFLFLTGLATINFLGQEYELLFHFMAEVYTVIISSCLYAVIWIIREKIDNGYFTILSIGLLFAAYFDLLHILTFREMNIFPNLDFGHSIYFWIAGRFLQSLTFLVAPFWTNKRTKGRLATIFCALFITLGTILITNNWLPPMMNPSGEYSNFRYYFEVSIITLFGFSLIHSVSKRKFFDRKIFLFITCSIILSLGSELAIVFNTSETEIISILGLDFKISAYFLIFQTILITGIAQPQNIFYRGLQANWKQMQNLINNLNEGIGIIDQHDQFVFSNPAADNIFGLEQGNLIKYKISDFITGETLDRYNHQKNILKQNKSSTIELEFNHPEKGKRSLIATSSPQISGKKLTGIFIVFHDITERKKAQMELQENEEKFRLLAENAGIGISYYDLSGRLLFLNEKAREQTSLSPNDIGKNVGEIFGKAWEKITEARIQEVSKSSAAFNYLDEVHLPDGVKWFDLNFTRILNSQGECIGIQIISHDITKQKELEDQFQSLARFPEENPQPVLRLSQDGNLTYSNLGSKKILETWNYSTKGHIPEDIQEIVIRCLKNKKPETIEVKAKEDILSLYVIPIPEMSYVNIYGRDITKLKNAEAELFKYSKDLEKIVSRKTEELVQAQERLLSQEKLATMGQMAGSVGHELRNPLAVINNALYILKSKTNGEDQTSLQYLDIIDQEVASANRIITDLLTFARIKPANLNPTNPKSLIDNVLQKFIPPDTISIKNTLVNDLPILYIDNKQIEQVIANLIINAYQAMPVGGELAISGREDNGYVRLYFTDTGIGIPEENLNKVFDPLFTTKPKGIGLGLTVSKILTEINNGKIEVNSNVGKGSTFSLIFPTEKIMNL